MQKHVNLVDLVKSFPTNIFLQNLASIQKRTSPLKLAHSDENQRKVRYRIFQLRSSVGAFFLSAFGGSLLGNSFTTKAAVEVMQEDGFYTDPIFYVFATASLVP